LERLNGRWREWQDTHPCLEMLAAARLLVACIPPCRPTLPFGRVGFRGSLEHLSSRRSVPECCLPSAIFVKMRKLAELRCQRAGILPAEASTELILCVERAPSGDLSDGPTDSYERHVIPGPRPLPGGWCEPGCRRVSRHGARDSSGQHMSSATSCRRCCPSGGSTRRERAAMPRVSSKSPHAMSGFVSNSVCRSEAGRARR